MKLIIKSLKKLIFKKNINKSRNSEVELFIKFFKLTNIKKNIYLDIGACVGELSFPFHSMFDRVYSFEPNQEAIKVFNLKNDYKNVFLVNKALSNYDGKIKFGGFGGLKRYHQNGPREKDNINEMNTILVDDENFLKSNIPNPKNLPMPAHNSGELVFVDCTKLQTFMIDNNISFEQISFIKMDIEGGEKIVIPDILSDLLNHKVPLYLELHTHVLQSNECIKLINDLYFVYENVIDKGLKKIDKNIIIEEIKQGCGTVQLFYY